MILFSPARNLTVLVAAALACPLCGQEPPDPALAQKILADATEYAAHHERDLPNFICTQTTRRFQDFSGREEFRPVDMIVERLTYFDHQEDYKVLEFNGLPSHLAHDQLGGASSSGEFGSVMKGVFAPTTEFHWQAWFTLRGQKMHVYNYRVSQANSDYHIVVQGRPGSLVTAYHGLVFIDDRRHFIHRITLHADGIPPAFPVQDVSLMLDYEYTQIGDASYLLPLNLELRSRDGKALIKNDVDYDNYRKFTADSTLTFK